MADDGTDDVQGMAELMALMAAKRAAMGIHDDGPTGETATSTSVAERELGRHVHDVSADRLAKRFKTTVHLATSGQLHAPAGPDLSVIDLVHRGHDGYIPLARRDSKGQWLELGCVPAHVLRGLFGADWLVKELDVDSYFGVHGMFRTNYHRHRSTLPQLEPSLRRAQHVRWLTTCHLDLDVYNMGMDPEDGVAAVLKAARDGIVPPPSMFSLSRGCWAWWLLRADDGSGPVRAWPEHVDRWSTIQGTLHQRLAGLRSDRAQLHPAVSSRIPGSVNRKAQHRRVAWLATADDDGRPFVYTLRELADAVGAPPPRPRIVDASATTTSDRPKDPSRVARGQRGYHSRWQRYMDVLDQLRRMRGGWRVGVRSKALALVAHGCRARGWTTDQAMMAMRAHLDGMEQPARDRIGERDVRRLLKAAPKPTNGGVRWQTVADQLDVSPEESVVLSTSTSRIPPARRFERLPDLPAVPPAERQRRRREAVAAILKRREAEMGHFDPQWWVPTTRQLREMLVAEGHDAASDRTLLKDLEAVGRPSPRRHKPRPPRPRQLTLPAPGNG